MEGLKTFTLLIIAGLMLLAPSCAKRQTATRLIYTPPPPAPSNPPPQESGVLVIQQPAAPAPAEPVARPEEPEPSVPVNAPSHRHRTVSSETIQPGAVTTEPAPSDAPPLEPAGSAQQRSELESRIKGLQDAVQQRIDRLSHMSLSSEDLKALEDSRLFLSQADQAMKNGDLQQSINLAQKADLLVSAVEQRH